LEIITPSFGFSDTITPLDNRINAALGYRMFGRANRVTPKLIFTKR